jgi:hypothetical protein
MDIIDVPLIERRRMLLLKKSMMDKVIEELKHKDFERKYDDSNELDRYVFCKRMRQFNIISTCQNIPPPSTLIDVWRVWSSFTYRDIPIQTIFNDKAGRRICCHTRSHHELFRHVMSKTEWIELATQNGISVKKSWTIRNIIEQLMKL